jgi:ABC-type multidrug transport system fused ATPase/permease subunit
VKPVLSYYWEASWTGSKDDANGKLCGEYSCHSLDVAFLFKKADSLATNARGDSLRNSIKTLLYTGTVGESRGISGDMENYHVTVFSNEGHAPTVQYLKHPRQAPCLMWDELGDFMSGFEISLGQFRVSSFLFVPILFGLIMIILLQFHLIMSKLFIFRRIRTIRPTVLQNLDDNKLSGDMELKILGATVEKFDPVTVEAKNVECTIRYDGTSKRILEKCSATFEPFTLTAIIGPSGCGKTTFLSLVLSI